jgi:hypothetical protein
MTRAPWQSPHVLYTLVAVFLCGAATGALGMRFAWKQPERHLPTAYGKESARELSNQRLVEKLKTDLSLTPEQTKEIEVVLDDFAMYIQTLQAQLDDVRATGKQRILRVLRDDQKDKFEKLIGEIQSRQLR